jgi:hypothetical protein
MRRVDARRALALAVAVAAFHAAPAHAEGTTPPLIWYRSGEGCPDGSGFLERLAARGVNARLAVVGEPIDFVVTLGTGADGARGLLERQTKTGTVAIRRLDGGTCDEIADGLALSLSLADAPEERRREEPATSASEVPGTKSPPPPDVAPVPATAASAAPARDARVRASVGVQANVVSGVAPDVLPGASLFVNLASGGSGFLSRSSGRIGVFGATGASSSGSYDYRVSTVGGRIGACPAWLGSAAVRVHPCASVDLGTIQSAGSGATGRTSGAFWGAAHFGLRLDVPLGKRFAIEAQVDARVPFTRYEIVAGPAESLLYRTAGAGFFGGLGAYFNLP